MSYVVVPVAKATRATISGLRSPVSVTTSGNMGTSGLAVVSTYGSTVNRYLTQPEAKSLDPETLKPALGRSHGVLQRRPVSMTAHGIKYIGKESNQLEEVEAGIHDDPTEVLSQYADPQHDDWIDVISPALALALERGDTTDSEVAREVDVHRSTIGRWRRGETRPHVRQRARLLNYLTELAGTVWQPGAVPRDPLSRIAVWLGAHRNREVPNREELPIPKSCESRNL